MSGYNTESHLPCCHHKKWLKRCDAERQDAPTNNTRNAQRNRLKKTADYWTRKARQHSPDVFFLQQWISVVLTLPTKQKIHRLKRVGKLSFHKDSTELNYIQKRRTDRVSITISHVHQEHQLNQNAHTHQDKNASMLPTLDLCLTRWHAILTIHSKKT